MRTSVFLLLPLAELKSSSPSYISAYPFLKTTSSFFAVLTVIVPELPGILSKSFQGTYNSCMRLQIVKLSNVSFDRPCYFHRIKRNHVLQNCQLFFEFHPILLLCQCLSSHCQQHPYFWNDVLQHNAFYQTYSATVSVHLGIR